jgi:hypothetical protein
VLQLLNEDELLQLIHAGGLITPLKGCTSSAARDQGHDGPGAALNMLTSLWTIKAADVSKDLYKRIEGEAQAAVWSQVLCRQLGWACFFDSNEWQHTPQGPNTHA